MIKADAPANTILEPGYEFISEEERLRRLKTRIPKNRRSAMSGADRSQGSGSVESQFAELAVHGPGGKKPTKMKGQSNMSSALRIPDKQKQS